MEFELTKRLTNKTLACDANKTQRLATIKAEKDAWEQELSAWTHERDPFSLDMMDEAKNETTQTGCHYLSPRQVLRELEKAMPARVMVSTDIGNINAISNSYLRFEEPRSFFARMSFGNCGYSLPTMIVAKLAAPDRPAEKKNQVDFYNRRFVAGELDSDVLPASAKQWALNAFSK